jgi:hypothetical protein
MSIIFNISIVGGVLLIAYWWANQGLFSAILHLLCVVAAGAIALAFWEPLTVGLLLRGGRFDNYAWGISLVMLFAVSLLVLRLGTDKLVPANVDLPHWANLTFGFPVGLAAGVITIGVLVIGGGFIQCRTEILGFTGWARSAQRGMVEESSRTLWLPVHTWTANLYESLSVGALRTGNPLRHYNPRLDRQAMSLIRDSYNKGRGQITLAPDSARIDSAIIDPDTNRCAVQVHFSARSRDFGEQLTISQSQVRLLCRPRSPGRPATVVHADRWIQDGAEYLFDSTSHYITTTPGQEAGDVILLFPMPIGETPAYIQIKGTRFRLPTVQSGTVAAGSLPSGGTPALPPPTATVGGAIDSVIRLSNDIRPITASKNTLPGSIRESDGFLTDGKGTFSRGGLRPSKSLRIKGIYEPAGTRVVQLNVSVNSPASIFGPVRTQAGEDARLALVDSLGRTYSPIGYIHEQPTSGTTIMLDPRGFVTTLDQVPMLPTSGTEDLRLLFTVTEGAVISAFRFGDVNVGTCNLLVEQRASG